MRYKDLELLDAQAHEFIEKSVYDASHDELKTQLTDISKKVVPLLSNQILQAPQIRQLICLGTNALLAEDQTALLAKKCISFIADKLKDADGEKILFLINVSIDQFMKHSGQSSISLLPPKFKETLEYYVQKIDEVVDVTNFKISKEIWSNLEKLMQNPGLSIALKSSVMGLIEIAKGETKEAKLALQALTYLYIEEDLIDDNLGIFGLADDIYVIEETASKLGLLKYGQSFLLDLRANNFYGDSFFFEEGGQLLPLGPQTRAILKSLQYLRAKSTTKINVVLPEIGPITWLFIIDRRLSIRVPSEVNVAPPNIGDEVYFKVLNGYIGAIFKGYREVGTEKLPMLGFMDDEFSSAISITERVLNAAIREVPEGARIFRNQKSFLEKRNDEAAFAPRHVFLNTTTDSGEVLVLAQKNQFLKYYNQIKPYGESFANTLRVKYIKSNGSEEIIGYGPIILTLCSDEVVAKNRIDGLISQGKPIHLIIENARNASGLISSISDWHLDKIATVTCFTTGRDIEVANELSERNINILHLDDTFIHLEKKQSGRQSVIRSYEHYLTNVAHGPKFESASLLLPTTDEFHYLFRELFIHPDELPFELKYRLAYFREQFIWNPFPSTIDDINFASDLRTKIFEEFMFVRSELSELMVELLTEKWDILLEEKQSRNINRVLLDQDGSDFAIFARSKIEKLRFKEHIQLLDLPPCEIVDNPFDENTANISTLIVPIVPSKYKRLMLHSIHVKRKISLNFSIYETEIFDKTHNLKSQQTDILFRKSARNFEKFNSVQRKLNQSTRNEIRATEPAYTELEDIQADRIKAKIETNWEGNETEAFPVMLSEQKEYVLLPGNAKILAFEIDVNSFRFKNVSRLNEGDFLLLRDGNNADFLDGVASLVVADFDELSAQAENWRIALNNFTKHRGFSAAALQRFLANETSIKKTATTIRNWLKDGTIVAPDEFEVVLPEIASVIGDHGFSFDVNKTVEAIRSIYQSRKVAREALNEYFTGSQFDEVFDNKKIIVELQNLNVDFYIKEVAAIAPIINVPYSSTWKIETLD